MRKMFAIFLAFALIFGVGTVYADPSTPRLTDIEFNGRGVPGFSSETLTYTVLLPYREAEGIVDFPMPTVTATAEDETDVVLVEYPYTVEGGIITIKVTDPGSGSFCEYKLTINPVGRNLYTNGNFEDSDMSLWVAGGSPSTIELERRKLDGDAFSGDYVGYSPTGKSGPSYLYGQKVPVVANKVYLSHLAAKLESLNDGSGGTSRVFSNYMNHPFGGDWGSHYVKSGGMSYPEVWSAFSLNSYSWTEAIGVGSFSGATRTSGEVYHTVALWNSDKPSFYVDDLYLSELVISGVEVSGSKNTAAVPSTGTATVQLSAKLKNQFGVGAGLEGEAINWRMLGVNSGVSISGTGLVTVTSAAQLGEVLFEAYVNPTYAGAVQSEMSGRFTLAISSDGGSDDDDDDDDDEEEDNEDDYIVIIPNNLVTDGGFEAGTPGQLASNFATTVNSGVAFDGIKVISDGKAYEGNNAGIINNYKGGPTDLIYPANVILQPRKTYILSTMMRLADGQADASAVWYVNIDKSYVYHPFLGLFGETHADRPVAMSSSRWTELYSTIDTGGDPAVSGTGLASARHVALCPMFWKADVRYLIDNVYIGELVIADIRYTGGVAADIPKTSAPVSLPLSGDVLNQLGTNTGLYYETISWKLRENYQGVSISKDGNRFNLIVDENAVAQTIEVIASCQPSFTGGSRKFSKRIPITLRTDASPIPQARNLQLNGTVSEGSVLTGSYMYYQANGEAEAGTEIKWHWSESKDGSYTELAGENGLSYTVSAEHANHYIRFSILPKSVNGMTGALVNSPYASPPAAPTALDVKILAPFCAVGQTLTGEYTFFDDNGDSEEGTFLKWYISSSINGDYTEISGKNGNTIEIIDDYIGKYVKFEVTPGSNKEPKLGESIKSQAVLAAALPIAENVTIIKVSANLLRAQYTYRHDTNIFEGDTICQWFVGSSLVYTGALFDASNYIGMDITLAVTPAASFAPLTGNTVRASTRINISSGNNSNSNSSSGGGGITRGSAGSASSLMPIPTPPPAEEPVVIDRHWAQDAVDFVVSQGIMEYPIEDDFNMEQSISRADFVYYVGKALGLTEVPYAHSFNDVSETDYYANILQSAVDTEIISKYDNFYPDRPVSREEVCKILAIGLSNKTELPAADENALVRFSDSSDISEWAVTYVKQMVTIQLMRGVSDTEFMPKGEVNRAQTATLVQRIMAYEG